MREILFRGKNRDGVWIYGDLRQNANAIETDGIDLSGDTFIEPHECGDTLYSPDYYAVNPDTVGQYTGITDTNDTRIFEGDILDFTVFDYFGGDAQYRGQVAFVDGAFQIFGFSPSPDFDGYGPFDLGWTVSQDDEVKVIGNIYNNPKLHRK